MRERVPTRGNRLLRHPEEKKEGEERKNTNAEEGKEENRARHGYCSKSAHRFLAQLKPLFLTRILLELTELQWPSFGGAHLQTRVAYVKRCGQ